MAQKQTLRCFKASSAVLSKIFAAGQSLGYFSLVGQSFSALGASSLQDVSAVSGSHSLSEAVLLFSLTLFGLISSEHLLAPP